MIIPGLLPLVNVKSLVSGLERGCEIATMKNSTDEQFREIGWGHKGCGGTHRLTD